MPYAQCNRFIEKKNMSFLASSIFSHYFFNFSPAPYNPAHPTPSKQAHFSLSLSLSSFSCLGSIFKVLMTECAAN
jgi:hypothetical protein